MNSTFLAIGVPFTVIMLLAAASDVRSRRIPNELTVFGMVLAPVLWAFFGGSAAAFTSVLGGGIALAVGMTLFALGAMGGGDAKLLAAMGAFVGSTRLLSALLATGIAGGVFALAVAIGRRRLLATLLSAWHLAVRLLTLGRAGVARTVESPGALTVPYGVAIAAGGLFTWYLLPGN